MRKKVSKTKLDYIIKEQAVRYKKIFYLEQKRDDITRQLNEEFGQLDEGWKDVLLGIALLTGVGLGASQAQTAKKAMSDTDTKGKIEAALQDSAMLSRLTKSLPADVQSKIKMNANKALSDLAKGGEVVSTLKVKDDKQLSSKLQQGYAITGSELSTDTIRGIQDATIFTDTLKIPFNSDGFFVTAGYQLSPAGIKAIQTIKDSITNVGGTIISLGIEASTDKEPITMGNQKLSELRANSIAQYFAEVASPNIQTIPDQGPNVYTHTMSPEQRTQARQQTSPYRYVKLNIAIQSVIVKKHNVDPVNVVVNKAVYTLVKTVEDKINTTSGVHIFGKVTTGGAKVTGHKKVNCDKYKCKAF